MLISNAVTHALEDIAVRERDVMHAYTPGAIAQRGDVAAPAAALTVRDPLCVAPPANAYFMTGDERGRTLFTRDGSFALQNGTLVDTHGRPLLGYVDDASPLGPLHVDPVDVALGYASDARIEADGTLVYERMTIDPRTGRREPQRAIVGKLGLARFAPGTKLPAVDSQHVVAPPGIVPHLGRAGDGNFGTITLFARERSGIDIDTSLQRLQEAYLALDAIRAAGKAQGGIVKTTMDLLK